MLINHNNVQKKDTLTLLGMGTSIHLGTSIVTFVTISNFNEVLSNCVLYAYEYLCTICSKNKKTLEYHGIQM